MIDIISKISKNELKLVDGSLNKVNTFCLKKFEEKIAKIFIVIC